MFLGHLHITLCGPKIQTQLGISGGASSRPAEARVPVSHPCSADKHGEGSGDPEGLPESHNMPELWWRSGSAHGTYTEIHDTAMVRDSKHLVTQLGCDSISLLTRRTAEIQQDLSSHLRSCPGKGSMPCRALVTEEGPQVYTAEIVRHSEVGPFTFSRFGLGELKETGYCH